MNSYVTQTRRGLSLVFAPSPAIYALNAVLWPSVDTNGTSIMASLAYVRRIGSVATGTFGFTCSCIDQVTRLTCNTVLLSGVAACSASSMTLLACISFIHNIVALACNTVLNPCVATSRACCMASLANILGVFNCVIRAKRCT